MIEMLDVFGLTGGMDPGTSLLGAKAYLSDHGFSYGFGESDTVARFEVFADTQTDDGEYAGKSIRFGHGGRAAILKHKLIVSGRYGGTLEDVTMEDWENINLVSRVNFFRVRGERIAQGLPV
tara:strand:- start:260 stop:625 length:366 start_codon:yes stop_codon:yes gene_type:complete